MLQVAKSDIGGGAERIARTLLEAYRSRGLRSWLAAGSKRSDDPDVLLLPLASEHDRLGPWARGWLTVADRFSASVGKVRGAWKLRNLLRLIAQPELALTMQRGREDFNYRGSWHVLDLPPERPDVLHCHNLHGGYFDLRALARLSQEVPTLLTLHDAWLLSGHCAHSFGCERWETGCGQCPDLTIYPAVKRDATADNWGQKRSIFAKSRLYICAPSQWLMRKVEQSMLASAIVEARVIPNGVDLRLFHPGDKRKARTELGIPQDVRLLLFVGSSTRNNPWKDYATLEAAVKRTAERLPAEQILLVCLGEERPPEPIGQAQARFIGFTSCPATVARFYQAADIYLQPSKVDTFPNTVLEALACGIPVVATAVGGIPEQVKDGETGFLVPSRDAQTMAECIVRLLTDDLRGHQFGLRGAQDARQRFDLNRQVDAYVEWYQAITDSRRPTTTLESGGAA